MFLRVVCILVILPAWALASLLFCLYHTGALPVYIVSILFVYNTLDLPHLLSLLFQ